MGSFVKANPCRDRNRYVKGMANMADSFGGASMYNLVLVHSWPCDSDSKNGFFPDVYFAIVEYIRRQHDGEKREPGSEPACS